MPGRPEPERGGSYQGRPLSSTIDSQAPASSELQVECSTLFAAQYTFIGYVLFYMLGVV